MVDRYILEQNLIAAEEYYDRMVSRSVDPDMWQSEAWDEIYSAEQALLAFDINETELKDKAK